MDIDKPDIRETDRIDLQWDYDICVWARHFNVSERAVKEAVAAVGDRAVVVRDHLSRSGTGKPSRGAVERPGGH